MAERLQKLRPDRDLQCYFERPSAVAALSESSAGGFTVSGCWRQQFDWAVVEWNRDNVFDHPALRNLPDGDLSGIRLTYEETRTNCIAADSNLYPTVSWPYLRIWAESSGVEPYYVPLRRYATPVAGSYESATADFELQGAATPGDYVELAWQEEHYNYQIGGGDSLETAAARLASTITQNSPTVTATASGSRIRLIYSNALGANANRIGAYGTVHGSGTETWQPPAACFSGGQSPSRWRVDLDFSSLRDTGDQPVPAANVRKIRWTWAAALQAGNFARGEFTVVVSNWTVSGTRTEYAVAGPGSRRIEDDAPEVRYTGTWTEARGNFSGGSIRHTTAPGAKGEVTYRMPQTHRLYLGSRRAEEAGTISVRIDGGAARSWDLHVASEDALVRIDLGQLAGNADHTVTVTHAGASGKYIYFDFLEAAIACSDLPEFAETRDTTLATDWDTDHSIAVAPERTAWLIDKLGFTGRANHYAGALWFYELARPENVYASASVELIGPPEFGKTTQLLLGPTPINHLNLIGDTAESVARALALLVNAGSTGVWARADGKALTITARSMGTQGNGLAVTVNTNSTVFTAQPATSTLTGGTDGPWITDLAATPRINRAARDWSRSFFRALKARQIDVSAAFSMELQHGDLRVAAGIAQRYPNGDAVWLNTPALQTNFSPTSTAYWKQVYADMAQVMSEAGVQPYLQFGEVQWWYFPNPAGMPFYDAHTTSSFLTRYGRAMRTVPDQHAAPSQFTEEVQHLSQLVGEFTNAVIQYVRTMYPNTRFEVLYPPDVNDTDLNRGVNLPLAYWTPEKLECLKTENFTFTGDRNLDKARDSITLPMQLGFPRARSSHLIGIGEYTTPWLKEHSLSQGEGLESVVLFALDQFCLIGYGAPLDRGMRRATFLGER